jgi:hypothetical protein
MPEQGETYLSMRFAPDYGWLVTVLLEDGEEYVCHVQRAGHLIKIMKAAEDRLLDGVSENVVIEIRKITAESTTGQLSGTCQRWITESEVVEFVSK